MLDKNSESHVHVEAIEEPPPPGKSIAFGLERMGLIAVKAPILSMIILAVLIVAAIFGIYRIKIDNSLSQLFRSDSKDYKQYEAVTKRFPATEFDVLVVVEGKTLMARENLEKIRDMVTDLQLVEGVRGLVSLFSARQAPEPGKLPAALFPPELPQGAAYDKFVETVKANEIIRGKLLSEDGTLALIVLSLEPSVVSSNDLGKVVGEMRKIMADDLVGQRAQRPALRRSRHAARDPQRGQARRADLQHPRHSGRLHHRDHLLPQDIVHGGRGLSADHRDPARARRPRLGRFQSQHVPERDDAAHHGDQLLGLDAADLRRARPPDRGPGQIHRVHQRGAGGGAGLRADPRHRRHLVHRAAILRTPS